MNRIPLCVTLFSLLLGLSLESLSAKTKYTTPDALRAIGNGSVYSFCQDGEGAVWMNTNYGLCRFNGNTLDYVYDNVPYNNMCGNGARYIYVPAQSSILRFETGSQEPVALKGANIDYPRCCMLADGDSLLVASGNRIYSSSGRDTLVLWLSLPLDEEISALARGSDNSLLAASKSGAIFRSSSERDSLVKVYQTGDGLSALFTDSKGWLWAGLQNGGAVQLDSLCRESARFSHSRQGGSSKKLREARTFCEDIYGNIYVGTLNGLFVISPDGICSAETDYSPQGHSICSLFRDRDNNIWLGTFYNGVFLCETNNSPFMTAASVNDAIRLVNAMVEDKRGDIWIVTDHYGLWKMDGRNGSCSLIAQTIDRKLKSAWYDPSTDSIWIGEHMGALNSFDIRSGGWSSVSVHTPSGEQHPVSIYSICPHGKDLYLAASDGVYVFTPGKEKSITRKIPGYDGYVYSIRFDENGILWICGYELMYYTESEGLRFFDRDKTQQCRDIAFGEGGEMTLAILGKGFRTIRDGALISYDSATVGLSDQYAYLVDRIGEHYLLGGTRTGLSIIDTRQGRCYNFGAQNGLGLSSAREGCILHKSDGTVWIGGTDGIVWLNPSSLHLPSHKGKPVFDHCNPPRKGDEIVLPRDMHSLSVEVTNFDYSGIVPVKMEYRLEGLDDGWKVFDSSMPLSFNNLKPGKYTLRVRQTESFSSTDAFSENSLKIRVKSVWYLSTLAVILYLLVLLVAGIWAAQVSYSRKMLSNELKIKEKEGR
ncbi:MAG: two-component regulator propeller domain-containing protein, partial [Candidatus Cryptobacteroides sp.]|nr:two-component regulator propeller domain-containing protein [Candidatus Cryptobacteroides sp.]